MERLRKPFRVMNEYVYHGETWQTLLIGKRLFEHRKGSLVWWAVRKGVLV